MHKIADALHFFLIKKILVTKTKRGAKLRVKTTHDGADVSMGADTVHISSLGSLDVYCALPTQHPAHSSALNQ